MATKEKASVFSITRGQLDFIMSAIAVPLHGEDARARNRFVQLAKEEYHAFNPKRIEILERHAVKGEDGKPKLVEVAGVAGKVYDIPAAGQEAAQKEVEALVGETITYALDKESRKAWLSVADILRKHSKPMSIQDGARYDEVLTALETI